ncbi:MAG TPA: universal stress protein [Desulfobulbus sp.]|nr:universal stress protein [Desulfobulbus sp.]
MKSEQGAVMKRILLAVDDTRSSLSIIERVAEIFRSCIPDEIVLLYVQKIFSGRSVMDELIVSDSEWETLKESLEGTRYQEMRDAKAKRVMDYYRARLGEKGFTAIRPLVRKGHAAEEILKAARDEEVDMIIMGCRSSRMHNLFMGSVSREVTNNAEVSVLLVK